MKKVAVRNIRLCSKDCLCLYVCPYGATDTENSIIDVNKCTGCGICAEACPSHAISMVPLEFPAQQKHAEEVVAKLNKLNRNKVKQEAMARSLASSCDKEGLKKLMKAFEKSNRFMAEDIIREAGFMLPQSKNAQELLHNLADDYKNSDFVKELSKAILEKIKCNE